MPHACSNAWQQRSIARKKTCRATQALTLALIAVFFAGAAPLGFFDTFFALAGVLLACFTLGFLCCLMFRAASFSFGLELSQLLLLIVS